jgi:hypothetical protein
MFDNPREQANGHFPYLDVTEKLPAELAPVHELLAAVADEWRGQLPPSERLAAFARSLPDSGRPRCERAPDTPLSELDRVPPATIPRAPGRLHVLPVIAAALVVALLVGLLTRFAPSQLANRTADTTTDSRARWLEAGATRTGPEQLFATGRAGDQSIAARSCGWMRLDGASRA